MRNKILTIGLIAGIILTGGAMAINAFSGTAETVIENVEVMNVEKVCSIDEEAGFGGSTQSDWSIGGNLSVTGTSAFTGAVSATGNLSTSGDLSVTDEISYGGVSQDWITGSFTDATTTIVAVVNPFSATVIVDKFEAYIQNGTSTVAITCGTSTSQYLTADPTDLLIDDLSLASSTAGTATTTAYVVNRIGSGSRSASSGVQDAGTNSEDMILWKSGEYISCYVDTLFEGALTEATNIFSGFYRIHSRYDSNF